MDNFFNKLINKYNVDLDNDQRASVKHLSGPALVLSGPGSGKTTVITARTFYLIDEIGINPDEILTLTFNKAAQLEMKNRFNRTFESQIFKEVNFSTFHSFCYSILRDYERRQKHRFRLIEGKPEEKSINKTEILKNIYKEINNTTVNEEELEILINEIGYIKNRMIKDFNGLDLKTKNFKEIYLTYEKFKRENFLIDFDDMLTYSLIILKKCPDILSIYKNRYKYYQIDEGQDLSRVQFEILKIFCSSKDSNLFIVADDDQSIYGFRGAEPKCIFELDEYYEGLKIYRLENNYRSTKNIVELSSKLIKINQLRYDKFHKTSNPSYKNPTILNVEDEIEQLKFLEKTVNKHLMENHTVAILYRSNLSSISVVEMFTRKGIPFELRQNRVHFFQHWVIQDIISFLRFALDPYDYESFSRIYYKMNRYISKAMMENSLKYQYQLPVIKSILKTSELQPFQKIKLNDLTKEFKTLSKMKPLRALKYIEDEFKYFGNIKGSSERAGVSLDYYYNLFGVLKTLSVSCHSISEFLGLLEELSLNFENTKVFNKRDKNPVNLITMHSSKGLEYDVVIMIDLINREIPGEGALKNDRNQDENPIEEERRLFYVGMTRAKRWLYMVCPQYVNDISEARSTFVNEVVSILNEEQMDNIIEGRIIEHKKYGKGIISSINKKSGRTFIGVDFKGRTRMLDLDVCLENGIITL